VPGASPLRCGYNAAPVTLREPCAVCAFADNPSANAPIIIIDLKVFFFMIKKD
jgi:hypothetical protein